MCFFSSIDYFFLPARTDLMNKIIAAAFWRKRGIPCAAARHLSISMRQELVTPYLTRNHHGSVELSTAVDNFVRNFTNVISFKFKVLTGDHHA